MDDFLRDALHEFTRHRALADCAISQLDDDDFFRRPAPHLNSAAIIVKHLAGNLLSRWIDFLIADGEKTTRNRDGEFRLGAENTRTQLLTAWNQGWEALFAAVEGLTDADLDTSVTIRGERHTVRQALLRGMTHVAYHVGQTLYLVRWLQPNSVWLTIAPGQSQNERGAYRDVPSSPLS